MEVFFNINILYAIVYLLITFSSTLIMYKFFGKEGLFVCISVSIIVSNVQSVKLVDVFGMTTVLGNIAYSNIYLATDIINERYGEKAANRSVLYGFLSMFAFTLLMLFSLVFIPSIYDSSQKALESIFMIIPRISIASLSSYLVSQFLDVSLYSKLKRKFNKLWLSNNGGTIISQFVDTLCFVIIGYAGMVEIKQLISIGLTMYLLKVTIAVCDTIFVYIAKNINNKDAETKNGYNL